MLSQMHLQLSYFSLPQNNVHVHFLCIGTIHWWFPCSRNVQAKCTAYLKDWTALTIVVLPHWCQSCVPNLPSDLSKLQITGQGANQASPWPYNTKHQPWSGWTVTRLPTLKSLAPSFSRIPQWAGIHWRATVHSCGRSCRSFCSWWIGWWEVSEIRDWRAALASCEDGSPLWFQKKKKTKKKVRKKRRKRKRRRGKRKRKRKRIKKLGSSPLSVSL